MKKDKKKGGLSHDELIAKYGEDKATIPFESMIDVLLATKPTPKPKAKSNKQLSEC